MYFYGQGVPKDYIEAEAWYCRGADQGHARSQFGLGVLYHDGRGVEKDPAEAAKWYHLAAEQGHADAQYNLGIMYEYGNGVSQDFVTAHMWYDLAQVHGIDLAGQGRDDIAGQMTSSQIEQAEQLASKWMAEH